MLGEIEPPAYGVCGVSSTRLENGVLYVSVSGEVDLFTAPLLERALAPAFEDDAAALVVDLGECEFVDSTAIGTLVAANARLARLDRRLELVVTGGQIRRALEVTGLDGTFAIHESRASALAHSGLAAVDG